jgi:peptidyl-prolyl cis-trans isomerase NIMA-interacting 1
MPQPAVPCAPPLLTEAPASSIAFAMLLRPGASIPSNPRVNEFPARAVAHAYEYARVRPSVACSRSTRWLLQGALCLLAGCQSSAHPRVGTGVPPPDWIEVQKSTRPELEPGAVAVEQTGPREIGARHILIAFRGSAHAAPTVVRSRQQALDRAKEVLQRARAGEDFAALAAEYTDEPGGGARAGDLGTFTREKMVKRFSDAAFALQPGDFSDLVETQFGFHVIQRTE